MTRATASGSPPSKASGSVCGRRSSGAGQITVQGPFYDTRNSVLSITGGTGAYRNSRGQMVLRSLNGGKEYDFIFQLS